MWVFGKIRESMESLPLELSRYTGKSEEDILLSSKASLSFNVHNNILTPDRIPEFCLPPRLCKRSPLLEAETVAPALYGQGCEPKRSTSSNNTCKTKDVMMRKSDTLVAEKAARKPLPFSGEGYGLAGIYESPNTRRKESLFHSKCPAYVFDRRNTTAAPKLVKDSNLPKKTLSGFIPHLFCKQLSEAESTESDTPSSTPLSPPNCAKSSPFMPPGSGRLRGATSCPSLVDSRENRGRWKRVALSLATSPSCPSSLVGSSLALAPPSLSPLDVLQCQERTQQEHILPLQNNVKVHLITEQTSKPASSRFTVRVCVVSLEGLWEDADRRTLNCAVNVCLTPGKLQQQESATIRNCRSPVFNEDFFFTELSREELLELHLSLRVVNKPAAGSLRRGKVIGVITKPLSQLLHLKNS